ncbi:hypothetical protein [Saccharopolyspora sp. NPDC002686]|uniref:hypothetical protein n=1 Tax=Saccharopolyspora sp. NPDC002686 TaxID=3154541 RepID=UPI00332D7FDA
MITVVLSLAAGAGAAAIVANMMIKKSARQQLPQSMPPQAPQQSFGYGPYQQ